MQLYPSVSIDAEAAYRRERIAEQFRGSRARTHDARWSVADRLRWRHRRDRMAA